MNFLFFGHCGETNEDELTDSNEDDTDEEVPGAAEQEKERRGEKVYRTVLDNEGKVQQVEVDQYYLSSTAPGYNSFIAALRAWVHHTIFPNTKFVDSKAFIQGQSMNARLQQMLNFDDEQQVLRYKCDIASKVMVTMNAKRQYIYRTVQTAFTDLINEPSKYTKCVLMPA